MIATDVASVATPVAAEMLLRQRHSLPMGDPNRARLRTQVIEDHLPMAHRLAHRYSGRGEQHDDLAQAAAVALVKAVDGFDPQRLVPFVGYAVPSIVGSIKRHFRDSTWAMRVPRGAQELGRRLGDAIDTVSQERGHTPTSAELADHLDVTVADVVEAAVVRHAYQPSSLDVAPVGDLPALADRLGGIDPAYEQVENRASLEPLLAQLPARMRYILSLRFDDELSQSEIAAEVGLSQMHVSRLLTRTLAQLRAGLVAA